MIYLDNAATSFPKPPAVWQAMERCMCELGANPGRAGYRMAVDTARMMEEARRLLANLIGAPDPERIAFTHNATDSLNMAIKGVLLCPDKTLRDQPPHVVTSLLEHNSVSRPLARLESEGRIEVAFLAPSPEGIIAPDRVRQALRPNTRLVALTHCSNVLGAIEPIAEIGAEISSHPVIFLVDAAQTAGSVPIHVEEMGIDLLAFPGHKGLLGPPGTGGLYVREGIELSPWREGGTGDDSALPLHPDAMPWRFEGGTPNTVGIAGLGESARFVLAAGPANILKHEQRLLERLLDEMREIPGIKVFGPRDASARAGVLSFSLQGFDPQDLALILEESFQICVRAGLHCAPGAHRCIGTFPQGAVRVSPGWFNTLDEINLLAQALREISGSTRPA